MSDIAIDELPALVPEDAMLELDALGDALAVVLPVMFDAVVLGVLYVDVEAEAVVAPGVFG